MIKLINFVVLSGLVASLALTGCQTNPKTSGSSEKETTSNTLAGKMVGDWRSVAPEQNNIGQYATREFRFTLSRWEMIYTLATDIEMKKPIFIFRTEGPFTIEAASSKLPGAYNAQFRFSKKFINVKTKDRRLAKVFKFDDCKLVVGKEADVTDKGCSFVPKIEECAQEFDVVKIEGNNLYLGARPQDNNICTVDRRPEALGLALKRIN